MTDDRVTLPLTTVRACAARFCHIVCTDPWTEEVQPAGHDTACLIPLLTERDRLAAEVYTATSTSPDCLVAKHQACTACSCACHFNSKGERKAA